MALVELNGEKFVAAKDVADVLSCSEATATRYRSLPDFPLAYRFSSRRILYKLSELNDWINSRRGERRDLPVIKGEGRATNLLPQTT